MKKGDGVTIRRVVDRHGRVGYCPQSEYKTIVAREAAERKELEDAAERPETD
jgi:hypothetical protein